MKTNPIFYLLTVSLSISLLIPHLVQNGMFLDGVTYSAISRNLAEGYGSIWKPHFTETLYPVFYEHPPLVFAIQSLFFEVLGDSIYTERIFSFFNAVLTAWGIVLCWRLFEKRTHPGGFSWMPVLIWITTPLVFWSYRNNMLENTLSAFTVFAVYFILKGLFQKKRYGIIIGSMLITAAFLSKGFPGLFPMIITLVYSITIRHQKDRIPYIDIFINLLLPGILLFILFALFPELKNNISHYVDQQLIPALSNEREVTTQNRFHILFQLFMQLLLPVLLSIFLVLYPRKAKNITLPWNIILFFTLIGISASFPLIVSLKQRGFYLVPSIPYFAMAITSIFVPYLKKFLFAISKNVMYLIQAVSITLLIFTLSYSVFKFGDYSRDEEILKDVYRLSASVPEGSVLSAEEALCSEWGLISYLSRIHSISLDCTNQREYFLIRKETEMPPEWRGYQKVKLNLEGYELNSKRNNLL